MRVCARARMPAATVVAYYHNSGDAYMYTFTMLKLALDTKFYYPPSSATNELLGEP